MTEGEEEGGQARPYAVGRMIETVQAGVPIIREKNKRTNKSVPYAWK